MLEPSRRLRTRRFGSVAARTTKWRQYLTRRERAVLERATSSWSAAAGDAVVIGCDGGRWSLELARHGWSLTCIDIDRATLEICRRRLPGATHIAVERGVDGLPLETGSTDLVLAYEVLR